MPFQLLKRLFPERILSPTVLALAIVAVLLWVYFLYQRGLTGPFIFDDALVKVQTQLHQVSYENIVRTITSHGSGIFHRPVSILSLIWNGQVFGFEPHGYKLVNLFIHLINTFLIYILLARILTYLNISNQAKYSVRECQYLPLLAAAIWACHPLHISTVLYVFQRHALLSALFTIMSLITYVYSRAIVTTNTWSKLLLFIAFPILLTLAIGSKENGILIIGFLVILEICIFGFRGFKGPKSRASVWFFAIYVCIPALIAIVFFIIKHDEILIGYLHRDFNLFERLLSQAVVLTFYLKSILIADIDKLTFYYDHFPVYRSINADVALGVGVIGGLAIGMFYLRPRIPMAAFGAGVFLVAHSLESTLLPLELVFEHRNYVAVLGIVLLAVFSTHWLAVKLNSPTTIMILPVFALVLVSAKTHSRALEWSDDLLLATTLVNNAPDSYRSHANYVRSLAQHGMLEESISHIGVLEDKWGETRPNVPLLSIAVHCAAGINTDSIESRAAEMLKSHKLTQDVSSALFGLINFADKKICDSFTSTDLLYLLDTAINEGELHMPNVFLADIHIYAAKYEIQNSNYPMAFKHIDNALNILPDKPSLLVDQTRLALKQNDLDLASENITKLNTINASTFGAYTSVVGELDKIIANHPNNIVNSSID